MRFFLVTVAMFFLSATPLFAGQEKVDLSLFPLMKPQFEVSTVAAKIGKLFSVKSSSQGSRTQGKQLIDVLIKSRDVDLTAANIEGAGGEVRTIAGDILTAFVPLTFVSELSDAEEVEAIEASKPMRSKMDTALVHANVDDVQGGSVGSTAYDGADVILGVVDVSLDYSHADFLGSDSATRVQFLRQRHPVSGEYMICVKSQIDDGSCTASDGGQYLAASNGSAITVADGHGSHVTGIAAGADSTYKGAAPGADIMFVFDSTSTINTSGATSDVTTFSGAVVDGVSTIFDGADLLEKAAVVNISLGTSLGAHDDTSLLEQGLNNLLGSAGRVIVTAAGNERVNPNVSTGLSSGLTAGGIHAAVSASAGVDRGYRFVGLPVGLSTLNGSTDKIIADIWLGANNNCTVEARAYEADNASSTGSAAATVGSVSICPTSSCSDETKTATDGTVALSFVVDQSDANNSRPHAQLAVERGSSASSWSGIVSNGTSSGYVFDVIVRATSGTCSGHIWLWLDQTTTNVFLAGIQDDVVSGSAYTLVDGDSNSTMTIPATASGVISVGSFMQEKPIGSGGSTWTDSGGTSRDQTGSLGTKGGTSGAVSLFSSLGPTGEISGSREKPDIIAPGEPMLSTAASAATISSVEMVDSTHRKLAGTSMSSPFVAGVVALMLQRNNTLTAAQVKSTLKSSASSATGSANVVGSGKVDALAALNAISANTSSYSGTRDVTTADVTSSGFKSSSSSTSSSSSGCNLILR